MFKVSYNHAQIYAHTASCFLLFYVLINFYKNYFIIIILLHFFFHENYFNFFMFRDVPECSGMFRDVPCSGFYRRPVGGAFFPLLIYHSIFCHLFCQLVDCFSPLLVIFSCFCSVCLPIFSL